ncbi:MAG: hypothetical protein J6E32_01030, partial [Lachnospiraceae bacterium]|nr:hypothetical protein [Lachnospiraceae bacterium]
MGRWITIVIHPYRQDSLDPGIIGYAEGDEYIMKVGLVYISTTPELIADVEREVRGQLGDDVELFSQQDPSILAQ